MGQAAHNELLNRTGNIQNAEWKMEDEVRNRIFMNTIIYSILIVKNNVNIIAKVKSIILNTVSKEVCWKVNEGNAGIM